MIKIYGNKDGENHNEVHSAIESIAAPVVLYDDLFTKLSDMISKIGQRRQIQD